MADEPIRISSVAWTGLPAEQGSPPSLPAKPKPLPSPLKTIACSVGLTAIGAYGSWRAISSGTASCRGCDTFSAADDPAQFGFVVMVLLLCIPAGLLTLYLGIGDARRQFRKPGPASRPPERESAS